MVQVADVAFDQEGLRGVREVECVRGGQDLDGTAFGAAVSAVALDGSDRGL